MYLSNISNDILNFIFNFLSENDKLNLIKSDKKLIDVFKSDEIKIQLNLSYSLVTDNDLSYLTGIHKIKLIYCEKITDQGLKYLKGVHTIDLKYCRQITDKGLQYLTAEKSEIVSGKVERVHSIDLFNCFQITGKGLRYLAGIHTINLHRCNRIHGQSLQYLTAIRGYVITKHSSYCSV